MKPQGSTWMFCGEVSMARRHWDPYCTAALSNPLVPNLLQVLDRAEESTRVNTLTDLQILVALLMLLIPLSGLGSKM